MLSTWNPNHRAKTNFFSEKNIFSWFPLFMKNIDIILHTNSSNIIISEKQNSIMIWKWRILCCRLSLILYFLNPSYKCKAYGYKIWQKAVLSLWKKFATYTFFEMFKLNITQKMVNIFTHLIYYRFSNTNEFEEFWVTMKAKILWSGFGVHLYMKLFNFNHTKNSRI